MPEIVFTDWDRVVTTNGESVEEKTSVFLNHLEKNIIKDGYGIYLNTCDLSFVIRLNNVDYNVILPQESQNSLINGEYTPLVVVLLSLVAISKKYREQKANNQVIETKMDAIIDSYYENFEDLEDYERYLMFLNKSLEKEHDKDKRKVIETKIGALNEIIFEERNKIESQALNPLGLRNHTNRLIHNLIRDSKKLLPNDQLIVNERIRKILVDYKRIGKRYFKKKKNELLLGNPLLSIEILKQIVEVEELIKKLYIQSLYGIMDELDECINKGGK